jgi:hypothetical protein
VPLEESGAPDDRKDAEHGDADRNDVDHDAAHQHRDADVNAAEQPLLPISGRKKPTPLESFEKTIDWVFKTCEHAGEWPEIPTLNTEQQSAAIGRLRESITTLQALSARLTNDPDQDEQILRDLMIEEFFARASGADIHAHIPDARHTEVCRGFLGALTPEGMLAAMSEEFGRQLRARVPAPKRKSGNHKSHQSYKRTLNLTANSTRHERDRRSRQ